MNRRATVVCHKRHPVDDDGEGTLRYAKAGMLGQAERNPEVPPEAGNAYSVIWPNGAWGFYSSEELADVANLLVSTEEPAKEEA